MRGLEQVRNPLEAFVFVLGPEVLHALRGQGGDLCRSVLWHVRSTSALYGRGHDGRLLGDVRVQPEVALILYHYSVVSRGLLLGRTQRDDGLRLRGSFLERGTGLPSGKVVLPIRFRLNPARRLDGIGAVGILDGVGPRHDDLSAGRDGLRATALVGLSLQVNRTGNDDPMVLLGVLALTGTGCLM